MANNFFIEIKPSIERFFRSTKNCNEIKVSLKQNIERPFSHVIFIEVICDGIRSGLVAKKIVHHEINKKITSQENQAVVEYEILKTLFPKFVNIQGCSVPEPILIESSIEAYVMRFVPGDLLVDHFKHGRHFASKKKMEQLTESWYNCGKWLKEFQKIIGIFPADNRDYIGGVVDRAMHRLSLICALNDPRIPKEFGDIVSASLACQIEKIGSEKILISGRHGDFVPLNIIVNQGNITVIDFLGYCQEPIIVDVLKILICLHDEMRSLTASTNRVKVLREAFLSGYGDLPDQHISLLYLCEAMQRIVSLFGNLSKKSRFPHHKIEIANCIRSHINWLMMSGNIELALSNKLKTFS